MVPILAMGFFDIVQTLIVCTTVLGIAFLVCLCLPGSPLKDIVQRLLLILFCVAYVLSPVDLLPEAVLGPIGLADDAVAVLIAIYNARQLTVRK